MEVKLHISYSDKTSEQEEEEEEEEEDCINIEVDSSSFDSSFMSSSHYSANKEFEFQSFSASSSSDRSDQTTTSPADELFYMGKLLPLHLPPRLEMVHKILQKNPTSKKDEPLFEDESFSTPLFTPTSNNTPFESCNISPSESCQVSRELNPETYFLDYLSEFNKEKKSNWTKKLKLIKQSSSKLKWAYLKSLFTKSSGCSDESSASASASASAIAKQSANGFSKAAKNVVAPFGQINKCNGKMLEDVHRGGGGGHRRSFSGAFKRMSKNMKTSCSSSISSSSADLNRHHVLKRNNSSTRSSEIENPIQAAIAHCKRSHQQQHELCSRKNIGKEEVVF